MALFKILSNMTNTSRNMPNSYHQGYCYFDVKTGKFWIDTTDTAAGRLAINSSFFGICAADQASVEVKTVTCPGYVRSVGSSVYVMFTANDTYGIMNRLALNVNNTGAAVVQHHGETPDKAWCKAGHVYNFVYDGEYYQLIGDLDTTYNTLTTAIGRTGTDTEARLISASTLKTLIDDRGYTTNTGTVTNVATGAGLTGGPITTSGTIKANLLSETKLSYDAAAGTSGNTNRIYPVALDKSGRLSVNVPWTDTDTKVTSVGNHYAPAADENAVLTANASGASAAWSIDVVKGITINRDAKGHVTGVSVTSGKIPANPNTNYYHKTGSWSGLTYTAAKVGSPDDLAFTIPTGTTATTVALGNHTHTTSLATDTGTSAITLAHGGKYKLTAGETSVIFTMPADNNTTYSAGTGLSLSGTTFNHSNSVTAKTAAAQAAKTLTWGGTFTLYEEKYDAQGHITGVASYNMTMPSNPNTDYRVRQTNDTSNTNYRLLLSNSANSTQEDNITHKNDNLIYNPSTMTLSTGNLNLTGELDVVGNTYLHNETQADSLTAGSLLVTGNANFTQIPTAPTPATDSNDTSVATTAFVRNNLGGLSGAMHFKGTTTTALNDGTTTAAVTIGGSSYTPSAGDVVLYSDSEFVWTGSAWERLGRDSSFKVQQTAVSSPTASGSTTAFIDTISQNANGDITVTKKNLDTSGTWSGNATTATTATKLGTANKGSATKPIYLSAGVPTECTTYAGGTAVTLNNSSKAGSTASFYAPTAGGTQNTQALVGDGVTAAPKWVDISPSITITAGTASVAPQINVTVLGQSGTAQSITTATTGVYGVTKLNSATNSTSTTEAATPSAVKSAYDLANNHKYWANVEATSAASYNKAPEMATIKLNGNTSASAASTTNVTLVYDSTLQALNFVFA